MPSHICFNNRQYLYGLLKSKNNNIVKLIYVCHDHSLCGCVHCLICIICIFTNFNEKVKYEGKIVKTTNKLIFFCPDRTLVSLKTLATTVLLFQKATLQDFPM